MQFPVSACIGIILSLGLWSMTAQAQQQDRTAATIAQALYEQAIAELDAKNFTAACPKLEQVTQLAPEAVGAKEDLAECYEGQGRLASAWSQYAIVEAFALKARDMNRAREARKKNEKLRPKLAQLRITVAEEMRSMEGLVVQRNGVVLEEPSWGVALPIDRGEHLIEVRAPGRQTWTKVVQIVADGASLEIKVPMLQTAAPNEKTTKAMAAETPKTIRPWMKTVGFVGIGVGGAGAIVGGILAGVASTRYSASNANNHCDARNYCDVEGMARRHQAGTLANGSTAAFAVGGAFALGGIVALVLPRLMSKGSSAKTTVGLYPSLRGMEVFVRY